MKNKVNVSTKYRQGNQVYLKILKKENKMKRLVFLMCIFLSFSALFCADRSEIGTIDNPYQIRTPAELNSVRNYLGEGNNDKYFKLMNDIDLTAYLASGGAGFTAWGASGWLPIGDSGNRFFGKFDGNNKKITGLKIDRSTTDYVGLFGYINTGGEIKDLGVEIDADGSVIGRDYVGGLAGSISNGTIINCYTTGSVTGRKIVGGLVGWSGYGPITNSYATGTVNGTGANLGVAPIDVGGLVGKTSNGTITNSYATGSVFGGGDGENIGGLVGYNSRTTISNSYATGSVSGNDWAVGGLIGINIGQSFEPQNYTITNSYATGSVSGYYPEGTGGLIGSNSTSNITNCFWNVDTDGINGNESGANNFGATGKTTAEMLNINTYTSWSIIGEYNSNYIWNIESAVNDGYPYLSWQSFGPIIVAPTAQATNLIFSNQVNTVPDPNENDISINWTASDDAESYLVVRNTASAPTFVPVDGTEYSVGAQTGGYVVYSGTANSATDANVSVNTHYYKIYAFNGSANRTKYLTTAPLSGNITVISGGEGTIDDTEGEPATVGFPEQGVTISFPDGTSGTTITSTKTNSAPSANFQGNAGVRGMSPLYFTITSSNATPGNYTIVLDFSSLGLTEAKWNQFKVMKRADANSYWKDITMDPHNGTIVSRQIDGVWGIFTISGLSSFSEFGGGEGAFTVTSNADAGENTLRGIIAVAADGDVIEFDVAAMGSNTITLVSTLLIDKDLTLVALGSDRGVILDGNNSVRVLNISAAKIVTLKNMIITRGYDAENVVAGIDNFGDLTLINCVVADNTAGGVSIADEGAIGGIYSTGDLTLINTTITNNTGAMTDFGIGGIYCTGILTMKNSILFGNFGASKNIASSININSYYSLFEESLADMIETDGNFFDLNEHNIFDSNPLFAGSIINPTHPYSILGISPAVDAGNNSYCLEEKDIRGFNRKQNSAIDIGAYEYTEDSDTLPVTLSSFTAIYTVSNTVSVMWTTQSESNMIGYHILRAETNELREALRVSDNMVRSLNQSTETNYSYTDETTFEDTKYFYWLQSAEYDGTMEFFGPVSVKTGIISNDTPVIPLITQLNNAYPNPFNPSTTISFDIAETAFVNIEIYNIRGQRVKSLVTQEIKPGRYNVVWQGKNDNNRTVSSGIYFYKMQAGKYSKINKVLMMK